MSFAGLVFSTTFRSARDQPRALGANLLGATFGGFAEHLAMVTGTRFLWLLVAAAYVTSPVARLGSDAEAIAGRPDEFPGKNLALAR